MTATAETTVGVGRVARVTGPVVDVEFPAEAMPRFSTRYTPQSRLAMQTTLKGSPNRGCLPSKLHCTSVTTWFARSRCSRPTV